MPVRVGWRYSRLLFRTTAVYIHIQYIQAVPAVNGWPSWSSFDSAATCRMCAKKKRGRGSGACRKLARYQPLATIDEIPSGVVCTLNLGGEMERVLAILTSLETEAYEAALRCRRNSLKRWGIIGASVPENGWVFRKLCKLQ